MNRHNSISRLLGLACAIALPQVANAQDVAVEGPGYEVSEGTVLHPSAGVETGFSSNVFYEDPSSGPRAAPVLRLFGKFAVASADNKPATEAEPLIPQDSAAAGDNPGAPPEWDWRLSGRLALEQYVGIGDGSETVNAQRSLGGGFDIDAVRGRNLPVSFVVKNSFTRATRPTNFESRGEINRDVNRLELGADYKPGNGAFKIMGRYHNLLDIFEDSGPPDDMGNTATGYANRFNHLLRARAEWQFLPITRFSIDGTFGFFGQIGASELAKVSSTPVRVQLGAATLITELTSIKAHVGYGNAFYSEGDSFENVLFGVEFGYRYSPFGRFSVALDYDFDDSINGNFYRDYAVIGKLDHQFQPESLQRPVLLTGSAAIRFRGYKGIPMELSADGATSREDLILNTVARAQYLYRDWLAFTGEFSALIDQTAYRYRVENQNGPGQDDPSFQRVDLTLGVTAAF